MLFFPQNIFWIFSIIYLTFNSWSFWFLEGLLQDTGIPTAIWQNHHLQKGTLILRQALPPGYLKIFPLRFTLLHAP